MDKRTGKSRSTSATHATSPKGLANVFILDIIGHADEDHPVTQKEILDKLASDEYCVKLDRKSLRRHLADIVEGFDSVRYRTATRVVDGRETTILTDFWMESESLFEESELLILIYGVIFFKHLPARQKRDLLVKLEGLSSGEYSRKLADYHIYNDGSPRPDPNELMWNLEELSRAIAEKRRVEFRYSRYTVGKKLETSEQTYTANPYGIGEHDGDLYLICTLSGIENDNLDAMIRRFEDVIAVMESGEVHVDTFRLDRMRKLQVLSEPRERLDAPHGLRLKGARGDDEPRPKTWTH